MKKKVVLVPIALLILVLALLLWKWRDKTTGTGSLLFDSTRIAEVTWLHVISGAGDTVSLERSAKGWVIKPDRFPADTAKLRVVLRDLHALRTQHVVSDAKDPSSLPAYGLQGDAATLLEWGGRDGKVSRVLLGSATISEDGAYGMGYWKVPDQPEVYGAPLGALWGPQAENDWRSRNVIPFILYEDIHSIETDWIDSTGKSHHYRLERLSDTSVHMVEPKVAAVPRRNAAYVYVQAPQFIADAFVAESDTIPSAMGLDKPKVVVRIGMKDGRILTMTGGNPEGEYRYALFPGHPSAFVKVKSWRFEFFRKTVDQLTDPAMVPSEPWEEE
jgi:hypothetical protein